MKMNEIGIIGLAVMGRSLALNIADHGYQTAVYNRSYEVTKQMMGNWPHDHISSYDNIHEFVQSLSVPRKIMLMVKAGQAVDLVIEQLLPELEEGDIVFDGGNSYFQDTIRRTTYLKDQGIHYFGVGVSGGEKGARFGPSIMPGGDRYAYDQVRKIFEDIAAKAEDGSPCCTYIGENGAGHYVKMVHNGIEYADMQMIAETYLLLKYIAKLDNDAISQTFTTFQEGALKSYLINITSKIFKEKDDQTEGDLIDHIKDASAQKGTGKWTIMEAANLGVDVSMIDAAYHARILSNNENRIYMLQYPNQTEYVLEDRDAFIRQVNQGLYVAKIIAYAQGFDLLKEASKQYDWALEFDKIAGIFRAGCIIQAEFLNEIMEAYRSDPQLSHLLLNDYFYQQVITYESSLRKIVCMAIMQGIPVPTLSSALSYMDMLRSSHMGANLIQAQRDFFGAHTYERIDQSGHFHHEWEQ